MSNHAGGAVPVASHGVRGRGSTALRLAPNWMAVIMTLISDTTPLWVEPPPPSVVPTLVVGEGPVVALRHRRVIAIGALVERSEVQSDRLVSGRDVEGHAWWIPADAVWSDAAESARPQHPRPVGLATDRTRDGALLAGLSDRLGWEAVVEYEEGRELPVLEGMLANGSDELIVLDGRLGHDIPTVVILGHDMTRWAAGATWSSALHRALYGADGRDDELEELGTLVERLAAHDIGVVAVDLATPLIRRAGVVRCSVQLLAPNDDSGRPWDAPALD